jgi:hypothetical protein
LNGTELALCPFTFSKMTSTTCSVHSLETITQIAQIKFKCLYFVDTLGFPLATLSKPWSTVLVMVNAKGQKCKETSMTTLEFRSVGINLVSKTRSWAFPKAHSGSLGAL